MYTYPQTTEHSVILAWKSQPRSFGRFTARIRSDTITIHDTASLSYSRSASPTSESLLTPSLELQLSEDTSDYSFIEAQHRNIPPPPTNIPPPPTNSPAPPSPKPKPALLHTMQLENIPEFSGTQEDKIQPSDFLKAIKHSFLASGATTNEKQKIGLFELYLKSDSPAEEWYDDNNMQKKIWANLEKEFKTRFPNMKKATKTVPKLERELGTMRIKTEELGKTEKYRGEDVYTHMIFAEKILDLATRAKIEGSMSGELPEVLREKIPENQVGRRSRKP